MCPRTLGEMFLEVSNGRSFLNFPQATQQRPAMALSQPPPELRVSPRYGKVGTTSSLLP